MVEHGEIGIAVEREPVHGHPVAHADADRPELALPIRRPHPGATLDPNTLLAEVYAQLPDRKEKAGEEREFAAGLPDDPLWPDPYFDEAWALKVGKRARLERANSLRKAGQRREAIALLRQSLEIYPDWDVAALDLGLVLLETGQYSAA